MAALGGIPSQRLDGVTTIAGDPMAGVHGATKLLGVDVQQLTPAPHAHGEAWAQPDGA